MLKLYTLKMTDLDRKHMATYWHVRISPSKKISRSRLP